MRTRDKQRIFKRFMSGFSVTTLGVRLDPAAAWNREARYVAETKVEQAIREQASRFSGKGAE